MGVTAGATLRCIELQNQAIARGLLADAHAIASSTLQNGWSSVAVQDLNVEVQAWEKVVKRISENQIPAKFDFHARALLLLVPNDKRINLRLATYYGAEVVGGFKSSASANTNVNTRAKFGAQYTYTIGLSLDSINRLLKKEFWSGRAAFLNICINKDTQDTCSDQALFASTNEFSLTAEPFLKIDSSTGEL